MQMDREGGPFCFSDKDCRAIEALGGDPEELFDRVMAQKAKGRRIGNVIRYMLQTAKNDLAQKTGVELGVAQAIATGNKHARQHALATVASAVDPKELRRRCSTARPGPELAAALAKLGSSVRGGKP